MVISVPSRIAHKKKILIISGYDPTGGAGLLLDTKIIHFLNGYALGVPTCLTIQDTQRVYRVYEINSKYFMKSLEHLINDVEEIDAVKIGALYSEKIINAIIDIIIKYRLKNIVLDPIIKPTRGTKLLKKNSLQSLAQLISLCTIITPNIPETETLLNTEVKTLEDMKKAIYDLNKQFNIKNILLKGGHIPINNKVYDILYTNDKFIFYPKIYRQNLNVHGTGCVLSSIFAYYLSKEKNIEDTFYNAEYTFEKVINNIIEIGKGQKVLNI